MAFFHEKTGNKTTQSNVNYDLESPEISNLGPPPFISSLRRETKSAKEPHTTPARKKIEDRYTRGWLDKKNYGTSGRRRLCIAKVLFPF